MSCVNDICGVGGVVTEGPSSVDPHDDYQIHAVPAFGGITLYWTYPTINTGAVKHFELYRVRGSNKVPEESTQPYQRVSGSYFYDAIAHEDTNEYFYWLRVVSYAGYRGKFIGPASAKAMDSIAKIIELISKDVVNSPIGQNLQSAIKNWVPTKDNYTEFLHQQSENYAGITQYIDANTKSKDDAVTLAINTSQALADANDAILANQDLKFLALGSAITMIGHTSKMKIGYSAYKQVKSEWDDATSSFKPIPNPSLNSDYVYIPFDGNGEYPVYSDYILGYKNNNWSTYDIQNKTDTIVLIPEKYSFKQLLKNPTTYRSKFNSSKINEDDLISTYKSKLATWPAEYSDFFYRVMEYQKATPLIIDAVGVDLWKIAVAKKLVTQPFKGFLEWRVGLPMVEIATNTQVNYKNKKGINTSFSMEQAFQTQVDINDRLMGQYHVKLDSVGTDGKRMISGYGIAQYENLNADPLDNIMQESTFLVNATTFAIGTPADYDTAFSPEEIKKANNNSDLPFLVRTSETFEGSKTIPPGVYIKEANIKNLTFDNLIASDGSFQVVTEGTKDPKTNKWTTEPKVFAKNLYVEKLQVGGTNEDRIEVTNELITVTAGGKIRVKIGRLS